jgi:hypothetical protein
MHHSGFAAADFLHNTELIHARRRGPSFNGGPLRSMTGIDNGMTVRRQTVVIGGGVVERGGEGEGMQIECHGGAGNIVHMRQREASVLDLNACVVFERCFLKSKTHAASC